MGRLTTRHLWFAVLAAALVLVAALDTWRVADRTPWDDLDTDNFAIGAMLLHHEDPGLFRRDPVYASDDYYANYTPSYLRLIETLTDSVTGGDFIQATALLQGPALLAFLAATYLLLWQVTRSVPASLLFTLVAANRGQMLKTFWGAIGFKAMLPRTVALPFVMLAAAFFLAAYAQPARERRWLWPAAGLVIGLVAILHPPSGMTLALTLGGMSLFTLRRGGMPQLANLLLFGGGVMVGALPVALALGGEVAGDVPLTDFSEYVSRLQVRLSMIPFRTHMGRFTSLQPDQQVLVGLVWFPLTAYAWLTMKPKRYPWTALVFVFVQLAYMWLMNTPTGVIVAIGLFYLWRWREGAIEPELRWMELAAAVIFAGYFMPVVLRAIWLELETTTLTSIVVQLPRAAKLFMLPLLIIGARFVTLLFERWRELPRTQVWVELLALLAVGVSTGPAAYHIPLALLFLLRAEVDTWRRERPALFAVFVALSVQIVLGALLAGDALSIPTVAGAVVGVWVWLARRSSQAIQLAGGVVLVGATVALGALLFISGERSDVSDALEQILTPGRHGYILVGALIGFLAFLLLARDWQVPRLTAFMGAALLVLLAAQLLEAAGLVDAIDDPAPSSPYELGTWAATHTDTDALFLYRDLVRSSDSAEFRFWSQRAVTTSYKDLDFVALMWPGQLVSAYDRWLDIMTMDTADLLAFAAEDDLDYIAHALSDPLPLPLVTRYEARDMGLYRVSQFDGAREPVATLASDMTLLDWAASRATVAPCRTFTVDTWWDAPAGVTATYTLALADGQGPVAERADSLALSVPAVEDSPAFGLLALTVPCELAPGAYTLTLDMAGAEGSLGAPLDLGIITIADTITDQD